MTSNGEGKRIGWQGGNMAGKVNKNADIMGAEGSDGE